MANTQSNAETFAVLGRDGGLSNPAFTVTNELCRRAMDADLHVMYGGHHRLGFFVRNLSTGMPPCASVDHMEDHVLCNKQKVTLNLLVESVGNASADLVVRSKPHPLATRGTRIDNLLDDLERKL